MRSRLHRRFAFQDSDDLFSQVSVIRDTLDRAQRFTAISGKAMLAVGITALLASAAARNVHDARQWLSIWMGECALALSLSLIGMSRRLGGWKAILHSPSGKRCALVLLPTAVSGFVTTLFAIRFGWLSLVTPIPDWLPGLWLLFYGAAVFSGGTVSLPEIRWLGLSLFATGICAAFFGWPAFITTIIGFGLLHIIFGALLWHAHES